MFENQPVAHTSLLFPTKKLTKNNALKNG